MTTTKHFGEGRVGSLAVCRAVGWVTFLEVLRDKILYNIVVLAGLLLGIGFIAAKLSFARPDRIILDFGLSAVNISCALIAIFTGASVLGREFDRRTIYVALSHPISKFQFLLGKFSGIAGVIAVNWLLLSAVYLAILAAVSSGTSIGILGDLHTTLFEALLLLLFQSLLLAALALMFSTFSTTSLSAVFTLGMYLIGNNVDQIRFLARKMKDTLGGPVLDGLAALLPNLGYFNFGTKVTYGLEVSASYVAHSLLYSVVFIAFLLALSGLLIQQKES